MSVEMDGDGSRNGRNAGPQPPLKSSLAGEWSFLKLRPHLQLSVNCDQVAHWVADQSEDTSSFA